MKKRLLHFGLTATMGMTLVTALQGCFPLAATGVAGTAAVLMDRRPVGVTTIDRGLQLEVESLIEKKYGESVHINVNVYNQKVLLTGEARTEQIKESINADVKGNQNIKTLINEIQVGALSSASSRVSDASIYSLIKGKLVITSGVPSNSMKIVVEQGRVYFLGLATELEAKIASVLASQSSASVKEVNKYFDIITEAEKAQLEQKFLKESKAE